MRWSDCELISINKTNIRFMDLFYNFGVCPLHNIENVLVLYREKPHSAALHHHQIKVTFKPISLIVECPVLEETVRKWQWQTFV